MAYSGGIFFANMGGGGGRNYFHHWPCSWSGEWQHSPTSRTLCVGSFRNAHSWSFFACSWASLLTVARLDLCRGTRQRRLVLSAKRVSSLACRSYCQLWCLAALTSRCHRCHAAGPPLSSAARLYALTACNLHVEIDIRLHWPFGLVMLTFLGVDCKSARLQKPVLTLASLRSLRRSPPVFRFSHRDEWQVDMAPGPCDCKIGTLYEFGMLLHWNRWMGHFNLLLGEAFLLAVVGA